MFIENTKIVYKTNFLTEEDLKTIDNLILANAFTISENLAPGGYKTFDIGSEEFVDGLAARVKDLILEAYGEGSVNHMYPRNEIQFLSKNSGMSPHDDGNGQNVSHGIVIYLSEPSDYVGGEIYYPKLEIALKPERGSIVIHPREDDYTHGVVTVLDGLRFVMVMFASM